MLCASQRNVFLLGPFFGVRQISLVADRGDIFDVLDADGSGFVDLSELIAGLLKLRTGCADAWQHNT